MLHRPADSRLLANLLSHEKDYTKALHVQLDVGHASLASFSAYAAASPPPASRAIAAVAGTLVGAQDALRSYALAVEEWCEQLRMLKDLEDEVGNIVRDREILVDRLIKASKAKDTKRRSLISGTGGSPTASLFSASSSSTALEQLAFTNSKLNVAQNELQACETHLAEREQALAQMRQATIVKGLKGRCSALRDCGWKWEEMAKDALRALESMNFGQIDIADFHGHPRPSSDLSSSIAPSQSASQTGHPDYSSQGHSSVSSPANLLLAPPEAHPEADILNEPTQTQYRLPLPPAHALTDEDQHHYVPSQINNPLPLPPHMPSPVQEDEELSGSSAGEESDEQMYEVHENTPFSTPETKRSEPKTRASESTVRPPLMRQTTRRTVTDDGDRHSILPSSISAPLPIIPTTLTSTQARKIDPYGNFSSLTHGHIDDLEGTPRHRKWSSIFSGFFHKRGRANSMSAAGAGAGQSPTSASGSGWRTRTDRNLRLANRGEDSSDEEDSRHLSGPSQVVLDYDALRQKSLIEVKGLPSPGVPGSHLHESSEAASTKSSPGKRGSQGRKKLRKTGDVMRKRNASAVDISSRSPDTSDISSRAVKGGSKAAQANALSDQTSRKQTTSGPPGSAVPPHIRTLQANGESQSVSVTRSATLTSNASSTRSAPVNRAASLDIPSSQNKSVKRGSGTWSDGGRAGVAGSVMTKATPPRLGHARTVSQGGGSVMGGPAVNRGQASLMSIVEDVSQQNRRGWSQTNPNSLLFQAKAPSAVTNKGLASTPVQFNAIQPAPRLLSSSSLENHSPSSDVVGKRRTLTSAIAQNADLRRLSTISASSSEPSLPLKDTAFYTTPTPSRTRAAVAQRLPLRSAMRNHSSSPKNSSGTSTPRSASPVRFARRPVIPPVTAASDSTPQTSPGSSHTAPPQSNGLAKDDDSASLASAYETGREDFDDDTTENPPTPPPHDSKNASPYILHALPNGLVSGPNADGTQTSSSMSGGTATPPSRRKSVRVSLQPTFSPTPPATYDDEEDHHPWGDTRPPQRQSTAWRTRAESVEDVWENSSDEDDEYSRAKQMLHSASRKLEKAAHINGLK